ncbi:MAG: bifunctional enoyl-CoA hydratase/phosphate acetyltransferase, partial [Pseudomonadota bacterium]
KRLCRAEDLYIFANASGNHNPMHLPKEDGDLDGRPEAVAPSMWRSALNSSVSGNVLPGPGTLHNRQSLTFSGRAHAGDQLTAKVRLVEKGEDRLARFAVSVEMEDGSLIAEGFAEVIAPDKNQSFHADDIPGLTVQRHVHFDRLLADAEPLDPILTAVVAPEEEQALSGALLSADHTLITPILIGRRERIEAAARAIDRDISSYTLIEAATHHEAAATAVKLVHEGKAQAIMKGHLHTDELLAPILKRDGGLRTKRRLSHAFVLDVPGLDHFLIVSDAAINITPDLKAKVDITQNAINLALAIGIEKPKVGILSAIETVNPAIPSTIDAAVISKMAERGQIHGGLVDGPLAMDNAVDVAAAKTKGIQSLVAGHADILITPNLEAGNMLAKELTFVAHAEAGGLVLGAQCPILLTSRADDDKSRLASAALAALYYTWLKKRVLR